MTISDVHIGDPVQLISGEQEMIVKSINNETNIITCAWESDLGEQQQDYNVEELKISDDAQMEIIRTARFDDGTPEE